MSSANVKDPCTTDRVGGSKARAVGRPRDPNLEKRVYEAAVALYEEEGWGGFSLDAVATRARAGKSTIYLRWGTKEDLLSDALADRTRNVTKVDAGSLRGDLVQLVEQLVANYTSPHGLVSLRLFVEAPRSAALERRCRERVAAHGADCAEIFDRAIERGELPDHSFDNNIMDAVSGGALHKVLTTWGQSRRELARNRRSHAEDLVDFVLEAVFGSR
jgi:AcrR family transcriptional regulator